MSTEQTIKIAIEEMLEGIQIIDSQGRYVYVNEAAARHGRTTKANLLGRTMMECYPGIENTAFFTDFQAVVLEGKARRIENEFAYADGETCWFELFIEPTPHGILIRSIDITERKQLEQQLWQAQKMEAIGLLAGGVAHDFNNKLAIMMAYGEIARNKFAADQIGKDEVLGYLEKILNATRDAASLTRQLLAFSRKQVLDLRVILLNSLLEDLKSSLGKLIGETISIDFRLADDLGNVKIDPGQIEQVILNLCVNARDAMPQGGSLTIETKNVDLDGNYAALHPEVSPGSYVMLAVADSGVGMDKETKRRIFEPFFTTKERGRGTGLGLSSVHGIVKQCRGHIWVYSEPGLGTVFRIYFPRIRDSVTKSVETVTDGFLAQGTEEILLVEDDASLREAYAAALTNAGYTVLTAATGAEAEALFRRQSTVLLLTDLILPQMSGRALAARLRELKPDLKVAFMSGYTENSIVHHGILDAESVLLQKPIPLRNLLETVRGVLDGRLTTGLR